MVSPGEPQCFLSPLVRVLPDVGGGRGAGVVAADFIKAGTLLARQSVPLVWSARVAPDCPWGLDGCASEEPLSPTRSSNEFGSTSTNRSAVTSCDGCLCAYDHSRNIYPAAKKGAGAVAKRCSACKVVSYCSTDCQRSAWSRHKKECALFNHVRKASRGRGPNLTQRLVLRLLLNGISLEEFAGGHSTAEGQSGTEAAAAPVATAATNFELSAASPCTCTKKGHCSRSPALSDHLNACAASAALLEGLLRSAEGLQGGLQSLGLPALPRPGQLEAIVDRLSANVHSITVSGDSGAHALSGDCPPRACPCCDPGKEVAVGLYGQPLCRFNHSCFPNAAIVFGGAQGPLEMAVVASRSILCGEEVCISYVSPAAVRQERRNKLYLAYAFTCTCVLCCCCIDYTSSSNAIARGNHDCSGSSEFSSEGDKTSTKIPSRCSSNSSNKNTKRGHHPCSISFSPAEAFDLQLRAVFCPRAPCVSIRSTEKANVLLCLENANQEYLNSFCRRGKAPNDEPNGGLSSTYVHTADPRGPEGAARRRRLHLPVLCMQRPGEGLWEPVQLSTGDRPPQQAPNRGSSSQGNTSITLIPEELQQSALAHGHTVVAPPPPVIRCCACGDTSEQGDVVRVVEFMRKLKESAQRLAQASCTDQSEAVEVEGRAALKLFSVVRQYAHPGNLFLLNIAESLSRSCRGFVALYNGIGLTVSQHLSRAAVALYGRCSTQHADHLLTEGSLLHFLSQADTEEEAAHAWSLWAGGDPIMAETEGAMGAMARVEAFDDERVSETRAKLALQARECLLQACGIFFSYEGCCAERHKGRLAEGRIADCERELHALGFNS